MPPYYHSTSTPYSSIPSTPRSGALFPPLRYSHTRNSSSTSTLTSNLVPKNDKEGLRGSDQYHLDREYRLEERGPFDEDDIELQLSSPLNCKSKGEMVTRVFKFCLVLLLGLVLIGASVHMMDLIHHGSPLEISKAHLVDLGPEDRAPLDFKHHATIRHTSIHVPAYPKCDEAECLIHQVPGEGAEPEKTATILPDSSISTTVTVYPHRVTATSPPICVPPHCYPHSPPGHVNHQSTGEGEGEGDDTVPTPYPYIPALERADYEGCDYGETPPICVRPYCDPHPPPGHHHYIDDSEIQVVEDTETHPSIPPHSDTHPLELEEEMNANRDESPPICVPPHCCPHQLVDYGHDGSTLHTNTNSVVDQSESLAPDEPRQQPPHCHPTGETPPICLPPHCYPHPPPGHHHGHDHDHDHHENHYIQNPEADLQTRTMVSHLTSSDQYQVYSQTPPICDPPHCHPHGSEMMIQTDQQREDDYLSTNPEYHRYRVPEKAVIEITSMDEEDRKEDESICMPPICVPRSSRRITLVCVPPLCVPPTA